MEDLRSVIENGTTQKLASIEDTDSSKRATKDMLLPTSNAQRNLLKQIMRRTALEMRAYGFELKPDAYDVYTMAVFYVKASIMYINTINEKYKGEKNTPINICELITGRLTNRVNEKNEKVGNLILEFELTPEAEEFLMDAADYQDMPNPVPNSKRFEEPDPDNANQAQRFQAAVVAAMATRDFTISGNDWKIYTIVKVFLKCALLEVLLQGCRKGSSEFAIGEEINITSTVVEDGDIVLKIDPSVEGKTTPKSDGVTER